jgi:DNA polymerase-4
LLLIIKKLDGLFVIKPSEAQLFIDKLEVERFFGVGKVTAQKMHKLGIKTGLDLKQLSLVEMTKHFGKSGNYYYGIVRGLDERKVISERERKSLGSEYTFDKDLTQKFEVIAELYRIEKHLIDIILSHKCFGRTLTLKVKYADFKQITRSISLNNEINDFNILHLATRKLVKTIEYNKTNKKIRLLGLSVSNFEGFNNFSKQIVLFTILSNRWK